MQSGDMADFISQVMTREGAWVVEPTRTHNDGFIDYFLSKIRHIPVRIRQPAGKSPYRFAERGASGRWFFVWVEDK